ncbi:unnamed protein product [Notodromas monacha]|uniref:protein-serine/threonine phosphatase n=1 Tax=Notodromas monacha TaxID=399045 RepID=A0A7R9BQR7_9CRUS|nr:unnamed protein product [Notodromas monacha]CAG0918590.1 unnamed protein product [Notodromas monacha]
MGAYQSAPKTDTEPLDVSNEALSCGANAMQGWRQSQEDAHNVILSYAEDPGKALFAVYDGHGGAEVAKYCAEHFPGFLAAHDLFSLDDYEKCLSTAFLEFDSLLAQPQVIEELKRIAGPSTDVLEQKGILNLIKKRWKTLHNGGSGLEGEDSSSDEEPGLGDSDEEELGSENLEVSLAELRAEANAPIEAVLEKMSSSSSPAKSSTRTIDFVTSGASSSSSGAGSSGAGCSSSSSFASPSKAKGVSIYEEEELSARVKTTKAKSSGSGEPRKSNNDVGSESAKEDAVKTERISEEELLVSPKKEDAVKTERVSEEELLVSPKKEDAVKTERICKEEPLVSPKKEVVEEYLPVKKVPVQPEEAKKLENGVVNGVSSSPPPPDSSSTSSSSSSTPQQQQASQSNGDSTASSVVNGDSDEKPDPNGKRPVRQVPGMMGILPKKYAFMEELRGAQGDRDCPGHASGCTAVVALVCGPRVFVANAGDSRCVLCRGGTAVDLSVDHKPEDAVEFTRIRLAGGVVTPDGRVCGGLNLSRSFGDHSYKQNKDLPSSKQMITADPDVRTADLTDEDEFLVLACDGIWNSMSSQEVVDFVRTRLQKEPKPALSEICREMFMHCTGCDNMTSIIVELKAVSALKTTTPASPVVVGSKRPLADAENGIEAQEPDGSDAKRVKVDGDGSGQ